MRTSIISRTAAAIGVAALVTVGVVAGAGSASAATASCYRANPGNTSTTVKGFDIYEQTGGTTTTGAEIDFAGARSKGACFVYIKASGGYVSPGKTKTTNANFDAQWSGARAAGLLTGTYYLPTPNLGTGSEEAAAFLANDGQWNSDGKTLPPVLDLEKNSADQQPKVGQCYDMSPAALRSWILQWTASVQAATTRSPIIYTSKTFWSDCLSNSTALRSSLLWVTSPNTASPSLPNPWVGLGYSFWQTSLNTTGKDTFPGDQDVFHGTNAQLQALAEPSSAHDYTGDSYPDVLSLSPGGTLHATAGANDGTLSSTLTGTGLAIDGRWRIIPAGDVNEDGFADVYAIDPSGTVYLYLGKPGGGLASSGRAVARGWSGLRTVVNVGDFTGDGRPDLLARTNSGQLWLYPAVAGGAFATHQVIGTGFQSMTAVVGAGDLTGDGQPDLITRTASGQLWIYPHTASGFGAHIVGPGGLSSANAIFSVGDFTGDGHDDVLVRQGGQLKLYAGNGKGGLAAAATVQAPSEISQSTFVG